MYSRQKVLSILKRLYKKKIGISEAYTILKNLPYENLGFAKIDHHRRIRKGFGEVIYCRGKTDLQVKQILGRLLEKNEPVLLTKADKGLYEFLKKNFSGLKYNEVAKIIYTRKSRLKNRKTVLIITGGTGDIPVAEEARLTLEIMGNRVKTIYDAGVAGVHRLLDKLDDISKAGVIIVVAGMEGALASFIGGLTDRPVIAVPTSIGYGSNFNGIAPLLTMLNSCAPGIAVMNIDNGFGAGYFASLINR